MEPRIQYAKTSDGVNIAFATAGDGIPMVNIGSPGFNHVELSWQLFATVMQPLAAKHRYITYDSRGTGLSDRSAIDFSIEAMLRDLEAVVERCGLDSFILMGSTNATPVAVKYAATNPERVSHLILRDGWAKLSDFSESSAYKAALPLLDGDWVLCTETFAKVLLAHENPEFGRAFAEYIRACCEPEAMRAIWKAWGDEDYDVTEFLPRISAPTLVVHNKNHRFLSIDVGRRLAATIPEARLALIDDVTYAPLPDLIEEFLESTGQQSPATAAALDSTFRTILFTDMEGSTNLTQRVGDAAAQEVLRTHNRIVRDALTAHSGTEIKHTGDGIMASFTAASAALEAAVAIQKGLADHNEGTPDTPIRVRIGLNAGEPVAEDEDLFGTAVQLAARVCDRAEPGQILASNVVQELAAGKGFDFADQGEAALKGFEKPVRLHEVRWGE